MFFRAGLRYHGFTSRSLGIIISARRVVVEEFSHEARCTVLGRTMQFGGWPYSWVGGTPIIMIMAVRERDAVRV